MNTLFQLLGLTLSNPDIIEWIESNTDLNDTIPIKSLYQFFDDNDRFLFHIKIIKEILILRIVKQKQKDIILKRTNYYNTHKMNGFLIEEPHEKCIYKIKRLFTGKPHDYYYNYFTPDKNRASVFSIIQLRHKFGYSVKLERESLSLSGRSIVKPKSISSRSYLLNEPKSSRSVKIYPYQS